MDGISVESALNKAKLIAVEAMFELFSLDREAQRSFEESLDNLNEEYYSISV